MISFKWRHFKKDMIFATEPKKAYKKLHKNQKQFVNQAIRNIIVPPELDEPKRGDLAGVYVYKFKIDYQELLLAYTWDPKRRFIAIK